ncbi:MAG: hypothetical protein PHR28_12000, partial [candidate division Zixibacteria bacterium]|nr:hypothetical protein [candidate division Zixibacteria bacterium]
GSNGNLLSDSTSTYDLYMTSNLKVKIYPLSCLEVVLNNDYSFYREFIGLNNMSDGITVTYLPLPATSPFSLYLTGKGSMLEYDKAFSGFDNNIAQATVGIAYNFTPRVAFRSGISHRITHYVNAETSYIRSRDIYAGVNASLPFSIGFDLEGGFSRTNYLHKDILPLFADSLPPDPENPFKFEYENWLLKWVGDAEDNLWLTYLSPRLSRPLGDKTGLSLTFTRRAFMNYDGALIYGFATQYLSPWASVWEGHDVSFGVKTYVVPRLIITSGIGYWEKMYLKTIEKDPLTAFYASSINAPRREDWQTRIYLGVQYPMKLASGLFIEPAVNVEYTNNVSNKGVYNYSNFLVTAGIKARL